MKTGAFILAMVLVVFGFMSSNSENVYFSISSFSQSKPVVLDTTSNSSTFSFQVTVEITNP